MQRLHQCVLITSVIMGSWLGMQAVHELGHVIGAYATGGKVARVVLYPLTISRTELSENPHPLLVVWAGPLFGSVLPLAMWLAAAALRLRGSFVLRFFAGFCLIANGAYIAAGSFVRIGDSGQMIRHGSPPWQLWLFGALAVPVGLALWHRQGTHFGLGKSGGRVSPGIAYLSLAMCLALIALGFIVDGRSPKSGDEPTAARTISGEPLLQAKASPGIVLASLFTVVAPGDNGRRAGEDGRRMSSAAISPRKPVQKGVQGSLQKCSAQANLVARRLSRIDNPWWRLHPGQFLLSSQ